MNDSLEDIINGLAGHHYILDAAMRLSALDLVFLGPLLLLALWFWPGDRFNRASNQRLAFAAAISVGLALVAGAGLGHLYSDSRPFASDQATRLLIHHAADNGFPSDHATFAFALAGTIIWWRRFIGAVALTAALLIGVARVYVGVHWPSDIVAGALIGLSTGAAAALLMPLLGRPQLFLSRYFPGWLVESSMASSPRQLQ